MHSHPTRNGYPVWTPSEDAYITEQFGIISIKEMSIVLGRTVSAIRNRRLLIGVSGKDKFRWSPEKDDFIRNRYAVRDGRAVGEKSLAAEIGCSSVTVSRRARKLGLTDQCANKRDDQGRYPRKPAKYSTDEERRAAKSASSRQRWKNQPHPRGMLGKHHSDVTKQHLSEITKRMNASFTPEQREAIRIKARRTNEKIYGTIGTPMSRLNSGYSRSASAGFREDLGFFVRSGWEANYARYLNLLLSLDLIEGWQYESETFVFYGEDDGAIAYTPDFSVLGTDGDVVYHEVKGWMNEASKERLQRMEKYYPEIRIILIDESAYTALTSLRDHIENWEHDRREVVITEQASDEPRYIA